jgi:membrane protein YdbS with pleckstrin-like domain
MSRGGQGGQVLFHPSACFSRDNVGFLQSTFFSSAILFTCRCLTLFRCNIVSSNHFSLNQPFKPAPALVTWLSANFILFFLLVMSFTVFPVLLISGLEPVLQVILGIIIIVPVVIFFVWVGLYYKSMWYELREDEMSWKRGVWFRTTGVVPFNRITNIDVRQGPVMRALGISTLSVQTAGYSEQAFP